MKKFANYFLALIFLGMISCQVQEEVKTNETISTDVLMKIRRLGFGNQNVKRIAEGYLVEGDIIVTEENLEATPTTQFLRIGEEEQYRTFFTVYALPRTISVSLGSTLPSTYVAALDEAIKRYNDLNLLIKFQRVSSGAKISIVKAPSDAPYLASAGFPTSAGEPFNKVLLNSTYLGSSTSLTFRNYIATILAHEIGHCIGFRHTDYMNRAYSCGGSAVNEGASTVGAVHIPGTPTSASSGSFMLACIGNLVNRPFTSSDKVALNFLY
jgi:hypothetical protein